MTNQDLKKFRTRWRRWLGQRTRSGNINAVNLLDSHWTNWPDEILERNNHALADKPVGFNLDVLIEKYKAAIDLADMDDLRSLDNLYCEDLMSL